ncbi:MAG TPA: hypothetical protein VF263_18535 [Longimicrobiaceae bacterium]
MRRTLLAAAGLLLSLSAASRAQAPAAPAAAPSAPMPAGFRELSFLDFMENDTEIPIPVLFRIPGSFVPKQAGHHTRHNWMDPADTATVSRPPRVAILDGGFYSAQLSMNVGYDRRTRRFFTPWKADRPSIYETEMAAWFENEGLRDVKMERWNVNGYPVLFVEAMRGERRSTTVYLGAMMDTIVYFAWYTHPAVPGEEDFRRWKTLKEGILASGPAERVW